MPEPDPGATTAVAPLGGLVVLDLSRVLAGPYATQLLADLGAEVWKIERPGTGDETRAWGPPFVGTDSAYYLSVNRNKRSAALDFADPGARAALRRAALAADVVVENFLPGRLEPFGLDPASLRAANPELVVCSITGYGQDGPNASLPGYDAVLQGFVGLQSATGWPDRGGVKVGVALVDVLTGAHAAIAILAALVGRGRRCGGAHLDVALSEVGVHAMVNVAQGALATGAPARRHGNAHPNIVPYQTFACGDGDVVVAIGNDGQFQRLCRALGEPGRARTPEWATNPARVLRRDDVVRWIASCLARDTRDVWLARLRAAGVPAGPVRDVGETLADPAFAGRDMVRPVTLAAGATTALLGTPWRINGTRPPLRIAPPALGADTAAFLARFDR